MTNLEWSPWPAARCWASALEAYLASSELNPELFTPADHAALAASWSWLGQVAGQALEGVWVGWSTTT